MQNSELLSPAAIRMGWELGELMFLYKSIQVKYSQAWDKAKLKSRKFVLRSTRRGRKSSWLLLTSFQKCIGTATARNPATVYPITSSFRSILMSAIV